MKVVMIGSGNVSWHLCKRMLEQGFELIQVVNLRSGKFHECFQSLGIPLISSAKEIATDADFYFLCVQEDQLSHLELPAFSPQAILIHTAGSVEMDVLKKYGIHYGCIYPLQTLSIGKEVDFEKVPLLVEASEKATSEKMMTIAHMLSKTVRYCNSVERAELHLAAVLVNNFSNHLYQMADEYLQEKGLPFELLKPLIKETVAKLDALSPLQAQTGPAKREATLIMQKHMQMLSSHPQWAAIYQLLSDSIMRNEKRIKNA